MRYPRLFIVSLVALGLAASPAAVARADDSVGGSREPAYTGSVFDSVHDADMAGDPSGRPGAVESLADATGLEPAEAGDLLDAVTTLILTVVDAAQRTGVLAAPEVNRLIAEFLQPPASIEVPPEPGDSSEPWSEVGAAASKLEAVVGIRAEVLDEVDADPIGRWRPLVERYFDEERVAEALSIIACESNGDPAITNPRSGAAGLFQFISGTWQHASEQAGFGGASALDPEANVAAAAWLVEYSLDAGNSAWAHWTCRP